MATLSPQRLEEIRAKVQEGTFKIPEFGTQPLADSPGTALSSSGKIIELSTGQVLGSVEKVQGTSNFRATPITAADLEPATPLNPANAQTPFPSDISKLIDEIQLTPKEQEETDLNKRIQALQEQ